MTICWLLDLFAVQAAQAAENARAYVELERAYRKQRDLDRLKDDFIATASHELRTPLTGVQGFLELLLDFRLRDDPLAQEFAGHAAIRRGIRGGLRATPADVAPGQWAAGPAYWTGTTGTGRGACAALVW